MKIGLGTKVLVGFAVALAPVLGLLLWAFDLEVQWLERSRLADQVATAEAVAIAVDRQLDTAVGVGWAVAHDARVSTFDPAQIDPYLNALVEVFPAVTALAVFDAEGNSRGLGSTSPAETRPSVADDTYFRQVMATSLPAVSNVLELPVPRVPGVVAAVPIRDAEGHTVGVVTVSMAASALARQYQEVAVRAGQSILLTDRDGRLAFHTARPDLTREEADALRDLPPLVSALAGVPSSAGTFFSPLLGDDRLGAFVRTARYNWAVGITMPREIALAPAYARMRAEVVAFAIIVMLTLGLAAAIARVLVRPVRQLEEAARALGHGDLSRRVSISTGDEIEQLGASFNEMAARLEERKEALASSEARFRSLNAELEERVRERTEALEGANRELEAFSYSVSHDLRAPLRAVDGFVGAVLMDHAETLPPDAVTYLERARAGAKRMGGLIDGLLALSRAARAPLTRMRVDVAALAREAADEVLPTARKPVELTIGALPHCEADPVLIRQVLSNLLGNAIKFSRETEQPKIEVGFVPGTPTVYFVRDNGVGFDMERAGKLFQPFQRLEPAARFEGSGIGLAIVQRVIARHGGRVWAEARPGEGATFYFTLAPYVSAPAAVAEPAARGREGEPA